MKSIFQFIIKLSKLLKRKIYYLFILPPLNTFLIKVAISIGAYVVIPVTAPNRIGHLLVEIDSFLKEVNLRRIPRHNYALLFSPKESIANRYFLDILPPSIPVFEIPFIRIGQFYFGAFPRFPIAVSILDLEKRFLNYATSMYSTATFYNVNSLWKDRPALFTSSQRQQNARDNLFRSIGWDSDQQYVVLHSRSSGYSPSDEHFHSFRNVQINQFDFAIDFLIKSNIYVVRIGGQTMESCVPREGLYDYALSDLKKPELDFALCSECLFFLGTPSGAYLMAGIFGVPLAICNICLPISFSPMGAPNQIGIPKLMRHVSTSKLVPYPEIFENRSSEWRVPSDFDGSDYELVENTPEEIKDLAHEALLRAQGNWQDSPEDLRRQAQFSSLIRPGSYSYGTASQCGRAFMKKYEHLLGFKSACIECEQPQ